MMSAFLEKFFAFAYIAKHFAVSLLFFFFLPFLSVLLDEVAKVIFKNVSNCCFEYVSPGSELII